MVLKGARAATYTTSLMQAEELWHAAKKVTPLASPILRYYSVMQAAQAVVVSSPLANSRWQATKGHGLTLDVPMIKGGARLSLEQVFIRPAGEGMMAQKLAEALETPLLSQRASLIELIAALPVQSLLTDDADLPRKPLSVTPASVGIEYHGPQLDLNRVPPSLARVDARGWAVAPALDEVLDVLSAYPSLARLPRPIKVIANPNTSEEYGTTLHLCWEREKFFAYSEWEHFLDIWTVPRSIHLRHDGLVLPAVGGNDQPQHPLVTWYLVLYAFSILARYHGAHWRQLLDYDENEDAVALRRLVDRESGAALALAEMAILEFLAQEGYSELH